MSDITITTEDFITHYNNRLLQHIDDVRKTSTDIMRLISDIELSWHSAAANSALLKLQQLLVECNDVSANLEITKSYLEKILIAQTPI